MIIFLSSILASLLGVITLRSEPSFSSSLKTGEFLESGKTEEIKED